MNWNNVKLILTRELRDQLRDRRTLFVIAVLPLLLYPLLGMTFFQIAQFMREHPTQVLVLGGAEVQGLKGIPPLIANNRLHPDLFDHVGAANLIQLEFYRNEPSPDLESDENSPVDGGLRATASKPLEQAQRLVQNGRYHLLIYFPPGFGGQLEQLGHALSQQRRDSTSENRPSPAGDIADLTSPYIF